MAEYEIISTPHVENVMRMELGYRPTWAKLQNIRYKQIESTDRIFM